MRFRWLAVFPLVYTVLFIAVAWWLGGQGLDLGPFVSGHRILVRVLSAFGSFLAVSAFDRGDHMRRAWLWLGWGTVAILLRDVLRLFPAFQPANAGPGAQILLSGLVILSNLTLLSGIWILSRSWKRASITLPGDRSGIFAVALVTAGLAVVVAGPGAFKAAQQLVAGDWSYAVLLVSAVVDILSLCLITPLLLTAVALRGGLFSWPWGLITASQLSWLLFDAAANLAPTLAPGGFPLADVFRGLAETYLFAAGVAQLLVIQHVRRPRSRPA
jgi:hypothetical protein